jgi:MGT family glycosyltransferase
MSHIGLITPAYTGHVNPMISLGRELRLRGHRVSMIATLDAREATVRNGLEFIPVGAEKFPLGTLDSFTVRQGKLTGVPAIRLIMKDLVGLSAAHTRELPDIVTGHGIDTMVVDQILPIPSAVSEKLGIPFVTLCSLLPINEDVSLPPFMVGWPYAETTQARIQNTIGYKMQYLVERPLIALANKNRAAWGLKPATVDETFSPLAQIAQIPASLDFPRKNAPAWFHNTGPLHDFDRADPTPFRWDALDGRPLIYATMGTLQNQRLGIFRTMAEACAGLDAQLVISLGRRGVQIPADYPGDPIVVDYAPQLDLLKRASLFIGHGGQNTVLQSLAYGSPMVLMPAATDQPAVAARAKHIGVAEVIPATRVNTRKLRAAIRKVRSDPSYTENARKYQESMKGMDAIGRAADIVEEAFRTRKPVLREAVQV